MSKSTAEYGNESISQLKGADRVRKRPGVIFGSDGLDGCQHAVFEILSNSIDEAREGYGKVITLTRYADKSIEVEDFGRGCPLDWNANEKRFNWELVFCELYAGGKYANNEGENYEYSLGLNGLGSCATQYSSEYMDVTVWRDGNKYELHFKKGKVLGKKGQELTITPADRKKTGTTIKWRPDLEVFTDIDIPEEFFKDIRHRQAVVNAGLRFKFPCQLPQDLVIARLRRAVCRVGRAAEQAIGHKHPAHRAANIAHPGHAAAKAGGDLQSGLPVHFFLRKCQQHRLRAVAALKKQFSCPFCLCHIVSSRIVSGLITRPAYCG